MFYDKEWGTGTHTVLHEKTIIKNAGKEKGNEVLLKKKKKKFLVPFSIVFVHQNDGVFWYPNFGMKCSLFEKVVKE